MACSWGISRSIRAVGRTKVPARFGSSHQFREVIQVEPGSCHVSVWLPHFSRQLLHSPPPTPVLHQPSPASFEHPLGLCTSLLLRPSDRSELLGHCQLHGWPDSVRVVNREHTLGSGWQPNPGQVSWLPPTTTPSPAVTCPGLGPSCEDRAQDVAGGGGHQHLTSGAEDQYRGRPGDLGLLTLTTNSASEAGLALRDMALSCPPAPEPNTGTCRERQVEIYLQAELQAGCGSGKTSQRLVSGSILSKESNSAVLVSGEVHAQGIM